MLNISNNELSTKLDGNNITLIDVRTFKEAQLGLIENSIVIPLHLIPLELDRLKSIKGGIVVICRTGARSSQACRYLEQNYFSEVYNLTGGIESWVKSGGKLSLLK